MKIESSIFIQKLRVKWNSEGDDNTGYFHAMMRVRICCNKLDRLVSEEEEELITRQQIEEEVLGFCKELLGECA